MQSQIIVNQQVLETQSASLQNDFRGLADAQHETDETKHRTFPTVFQFTPFFRIYREKFTVVKLTLGHRKFSVVRNKKWRKSWCVAKKRRKKP